MNVSKETLSLFRQALETGDPTMLEKAGWTQPATATAGLALYDLSAPAMDISQPKITPLRDSIPRVAGSSGIQANWRAITGINTAQVPATTVEGKRGGVVTTTTAEYLAAFRGIGLEDTVSFEAGYAAEGFQDVRALAASNLLKAVMVAEESLILGGHGTWALGTTPTPVGVAATGGTMTARTVIAFCIALTLDGYKRATVSATGLINTVSVLHAGPYNTSTAVNAGHAVISAAATGVVVAAGNDKKVTWTVAAVPGAFAYAWYTGITNAAGTRLAAITTVNKFVQLADEVGTNQAGDAAGLNVDRSQNALAFDGLVAIATKSGSGSYYRSLDGADLTGNNDGSITEFDVALAAFYGSAPTGNLRLSPTDMWVSPADITKISSRVVNGGAAPIARLNFTTDGAGSITGGSLKVQDYLNRVTGEIVKITPHPEIPSGKIIFTSSSISYPIPGMVQTMRILERAGYRAYDWPLVQRQYEYGVYVDEVLQHFFPPSLGILDNFVLA